eukprot:CAMPEP_0205827182 /NCGR_PEP_ID=MMETSP0206-20130828/31164_1 /ASSEMBLY_ACC=CAM_ASM_000279 /TAXON_ID=36767 /ORGANISM="Euplotes focardii, Strain TN1" /LENGTH=104 /DNA_ID=CAMNT_0053127843 /DNA_START=98 /DNA_END=412 /DNA_ORIENTATION=-
MKKQLIKYDAVISQQRKDEIHKENQEGQGDSNNENKEIINFTKELFQCLFNSIEVCGQNIQDTPAEEQAESEATPLPVEKRTGILTNRKACFEGVFSKYIVDFS